MKAVVTRLLQTGIVPVVRCQNATHALLAADALLEGGIDVIEITLTVPGALGVISELRRRFASELLVGAGSVADLGLCRGALEAGSQFVVSPGLDLDVVAHCRAREVAAVPGALTPSEIMAAVKAGADLVKLFPCSALGGAKYLRAVRAPLPHVRFLPTGGVTLESVADYVRAGAAALGVGGELVDNQALGRGERQPLSERARQYVTALAEARARSEVSDG